ncbi:MarR family winged helix-turn-helix transcriptional regulator [Acetilactobacillus jinshanensis]|uniref:MarR family transcriptional regulator n=1 Tax=Acetilactobacillus jinshanensis TaxID=1720083 RepID=A0A4P6ZJ79_9LACO|nr:MarR family winged helix-turn-helix transcriptional regulator [Acetilactobacillus jinshanensis]QBP17785.1 MarR family transcriptional regulator [Acetilactobacillus jinshanensis]URL60647.1 winged helix-turn-helix transcriptional regulator [uncultured bacterium]
MEDIGRLIKKASAQMSRRFNQFAKQYHLTAVQMSLIDFLYIHRDRAIFQRDVEHEFMIRRSTASILLKRMGNRGLIMRKSSPTDARQRQVILTDKSKRLEHVITTYMSRQQHQIQAQFTPDQMKLLNQLLKNLINQK